MRNFLMRRQRGEAHTRDKKARKKKLKGCKKSIRREIGQNRAKSGGNCEGTLCQLFDEAAEAGTRGVRRIKKRVAPHRFS